MSARLPPPTGALICRIRPTVCHGVVTNDDGHAETEAPDPNGKGTVTYGNANGAGPADTRPDLLTGL